MASMSDYMVLLPGMVELQDGAGARTDLKQIDFELPADFTAGTQFAQPVLAFILNPRSSAVTVGAWVNPPSQDQLLQSQREVSLSWSKPAHTDFGLWEPIRGDHFVKGGRNAIVFKAVEGHVLLRAVVLWFQRGSGD